jgi:hypothetical protein
MKTSVRATATLNRAVLPWLSGELFPFALSNTVYYLLFLNTYTANVKKGMEAVLRIDNKPTGARKDCCEWKLWMSRLVEFSEG